MFDKVGVFNKWYGDMVVPANENDLLDLIALTDSKAVADSINSTTQPHKKWAVVSCLQKAVRRGHLDMAYRCACALNTLDPDYLWRRLQVIALEDVGLGNPLACALTMAAAKSKTWRKKVGEKEVLFTIVKWLTTGSKDRTLTDLVMLGLLVPETDMPWKSGDLVQSLTEQVQADWKIIGTGRFENKMLPLTQPDKERYEKVVADADVPFIIKYTAVRGRTSMSEPLFLGIGALWQHIESVMSTVSFDVKGVDESGDVMIWNLLSSSLDFHTQEGKRALAYISKSNEQVAEFKAKYIANFEDWLDVLGGHALFKVETAHLDIQLEFEGRQEVCDHSWDVCYESVGMTSEMATELETILREGREGLNHARRRVIEKAGGKP